MWINHQVWIIFVEKPWVFHIYVNVYSRVYSWQVISNRHIIHWEFSSSKIETKIDHHIWSLKWDTHGLLMGIQWDRFRGYDPPVSTWIAWKSSNQLMWSGDVGFWSWHPICLAILCTVYNIYIYINIHMVVIVDICIILHLIIYIHIQ